MLWGGGATGRMRAGTSAFVFAKSVEKRRAFLHLPAPARAMPEELSDPVPEGRRSLPLVLPDAGVLQGDGVHGDKGDLLVEHDSHHLHVLQPGDGLPVDVRDQVASSQASLPGGASHVYRLQEDTKEK